MNTTNLITAGFIALTSSVGTYAVTSFVQNDKGQQISKNETLTNNKAEPKGYRTSIPLIRSEETQQYILDTIRANPDAVLDALKIIGAREGTQADTYDDMNDAYENDTVEFDVEDPTNAHVSGNLQGDITIVQFFDYNCGHCREAEHVVREVVEQDGNIKLVFREFPILSKGSAFAARASLAAREQNLYEKFHTALMSQGEPLTEQNVLLVAVEVGLNIEKLKTDMYHDSVAEHLRQSQELALYSGIEGTPSYSIGGEIHTGAPSKSTLKKVIQDIRNK